MTTETHDFEARITESVQDALNQFSDDVRLNLTSLREELRIERSARHEMEKHFKTLASAIEQTHRRPGASTGQSGPASEDVQNLLASMNERLDKVEVSNERNRKEADERLNRLIDDANSSLPAIVDNAVGELDRSVTHRQQTSDNAIEKLHERLNNFDVQAARMVEYFTESTEMLSGRIDERVAAPAPSESTDSPELANKLAELAKQIETLEESARKSTAEQVDAAERRVDERFTTKLQMADERMGQQLADMDAYLGSTGNGLDDAITTLNDRISDLDGRIADLANQSPQPAPQPAPVATAPQPTQAAASAEPNSVPAVVFHR